MSWGVLVSSKPTRKALLPDNPPVPTAVALLVAGSRPVDAQSQRLAAGEAGRKRLHAANTSFADNHNAMRDTARFLTKRLVEALDGDDFHGREKFPLPCAFLADGAAFLADEPTKGRDECGDGGGAQSQGRKQGIRVEV